MWIIYSIISLVSASIMQILLKKTLNNVDPLVSSVVRNICLFVFSFSLLFMNNTKDKILMLTRKEIINLVIVGIFTFIAYTSYFLAVKEGNIVNVVVIDKLSIILVIILSIIFLDEKITLKLLIGSIITMIGVLILVIK